MQVITADAVTLGAGKVPPWLSSYPLGTRWDTALEPQPLWQFMDSAAKRFPRRTCCIFLGRTTSYAEMAERVTTAAAALQRLGIGKGSRVGLFLPNSPTFIQYYYAVMKTGATVVNFNPLYAPEELAEQARDCALDLIITLDLKVLFHKIEPLLLTRLVPRALVCSFAGLLPPTRSVLFSLFKSRELAHLAHSPAAAHILNERDVVTADQTFSPVTVDPTTDIAVLQYTGGTTGTPKGAMLTHANLSINVQQVMAWAPHFKAGEERVLGVLPFFHVFAMTVVLNLGVAMAAEIIVMPRFHLDEALRLIHRLRPTMMPGVPTLFNAILNHPKLGQHDLSCLKFCLSGGAALPLEVKNRFEAATGCSLVEGYGLSEASPVVTCNPLQGPVKAGSIGLPLPQTRVMLRDLVDPAREVAVGERGELCIAGPQVMQGYWRRPEDTAAQRHGEYLRTGDVAVMDGDGFLYIVDRIKDLIISSGYNVYPRRIEEAIYEHPAVEEVTVIAIKDTHRGEVPKAFVKLKADAALSEADLLAHLAPKLSKIELPAVIEFRDALPKTIIGKLSKKELKAEEEARARPT